MSDFVRSVKSSFGRLAAGVLGQIINTFGQIAVVPMFLHFWTKRGYGEWLVLTAVPNLLWSLEGGLGLLAVNQMVRCAATDDWKAANRLFQNIFVLQMIISAIIVIGGILVAKLVNFLPFLDIKEMSRPDAAFILMVMLCYMTFGWAISLLRAPYFASELSTRGSMVINFWRLSDFLMICLVLFFHGGARLVATGETFIAALWTLLACIDINRKCPRFHFYLSDVSWSSCKGVFRDGAPLFLVQAGNAFYIQGYPLVLSRTLGTLAVVNFTAIRTVTRVLLQSILVVINAASVELARSIATKKWELFLRWAKIIGACVLGGGICGCIGLYYLGPIVMAGWTHGKVVVGASLLLLFGISVTLQAATSMFGALLYSANKHHLQCSIYFVITVAALVIGRFTIGSLGFTSVPIIMICADSLYLVISIALSFHYLREVELASLVLLFNPYFYFNKIKWAIGLPRVQNIFFFWSPNR